MGGGGANAPARYFGRVVASGGVLLRISANRFGRAVFDENQKPSDGRFWLILMIS